MKKILLCALPIVLFIASCGAPEQDKQADQDNMSKVSEAAPTPDDFKVVMHEPVDSVWAKAMQASFDRNAFRALSNKNQILGKSFTLSKTQYGSIINSMTNNDTILRIYFVQFRKSDFPEKYAELSKYDGKLYIVYSISDNATSVTQYFASFSIGKTLNIPSKDFALMQNNYTQYILPEIENFGVKKVNTNYIKIKKSELDIHLDLINDLDNSETIRFSLAEVVDPASIDFTPPRPFTQQDMVGQLTLLTDVLDGQGDQIGTIPYYDLNGLCPRNCN